MADQIEAGKGKAAGIVGIFLLVLGLINVILGIMWAVYGGSDGSGLWCGFLLMAQGSLGLVAWLKRNKLAMVFYLVLALLNIIITIVQAALAALAWLIWQVVKAIIETKCSDSSGRCVCSGETVPMNVDSCSTITSIDAVFLCLLILNGIACIFAFAGSIIGCMAVCCASSPPAQTNVVVVQQPAMVGVGQQPVGAGYPSYPPQQQQQGFAMQEATPQN
ncbi:uncharacterized protein LOC116616016 [Nematostella vectensis]|uniref:uncharacterized protein LOC116616016 n=1 Tax=Nematostella vectensis TaxID=45351 RepID=UPI00138FFE3F|nr:uncharacterized protein LOC116616016 [Nematostella vectensis]